MTPSLYFDYNKSAFAWGQANLNCKGIWWGEKCYAFKGHLSPKSWLFDQILLQIVPFVVLGTLEKKYGEGSILDVFGAKSEENDKVSKIKLETVPDGVTL